MRLYLLRHAEAHPGSPDELRALTRAGEKSVRRLGRFLRERPDFAPSLLRHSGLVRARQTAEILRESLSRALPLEESPGLTPEDDPRLALAGLADAPDGLVLVGHNPHLSDLANLLLARRGAAPIDLRKGALLALQSDAGPAGPWQVRWLLTTKLLEEP